MRYKYPRTLHFPESPGATSDDKILQDDSKLKGKTFVLTEKMDGECTTMARDYFHARSITDNHHPSRNFVKGIWGKIAHLIPEGWRICGENMYAMHSIYYTNLASYFLVYSVWDEKNMCLSWDDTLSFCKNIDLVPVPWYFSMEYNSTTIQNYCKTFEVSNPHREGIVARNVDSFHYDDFQDNVVKWVRADHVETDFHWMTKAIIPNKLKEECISKFQYQTEK